MKMKLLLTLALGCCLALAACDELGSTGGEGQAAEGESTMEPTATYSVDSGGVTQPAPETGGSKRQSFLVITSMAVTPAVGTGKFTADVHYSGGVSESVHCWVRNDDGSQAVTEIGWIDFPSSPGPTALADFPVNFNVTAVGNYTALCQTQSQNAWGSYPFEVQEPTPKPYRGQPFPQPQYLLHVASTCSEGFFLYPQDASNGSISVPDGTGGTNTYTVDYSSGPYTAPAEVCGVADVTFGGATLHAWNSTASFFCP